MGFLFLISLLASFRNVLANPLLEIPEYSDSLVNDDPLYSENFDESNAYPLWPTEDYSDAGLFFPPIEPSADSPLETFQVDFLPADSLLETFEGNSVLVTASGEYLGTPCQTDSSSIETFYIKRDGICPVGETPLSVPELDLKLPGFEDLEQALSSSRDPATSLIRGYRIHRIPGYSKDDDDRCLPPKRLLCCQGPLEGFLLKSYTFDLISDCRGMTLKFSSIAEKTPPSLLVNGPTVRVDTNELWDMKISGLTYAPRDT